MGIVNLYKRHLLTLADYSKEEIIYLIDVAAKIKNEKKNGIFPKRLANKNIALIFEKPSTRTRCSFAVACADEGAHSEYLGKTEIQLGAKESVKNTARILGRMFDGIEFRGFAHNHVEQLAEYSGVPVWNGLTDYDHPTQALADFLTIREKFGTLDGLKFTYIGDGRNNVANALMIASAKLGVDYCVCAPKSLFPDENLLSMCKKFAAESGSKIIVTDYTGEAAAGSDVIYTDVWCSMGEEDKAAERVALLKDYQVNSAFMKKAKNNAIFMHCLPAVLGNEVTEEVFESSQSVVFDEAENRMHTIKAVMLASLVENDKL